jgi:cation transporter-like permease
MLGNLDAEARGGRGRDVSELLTNFSRQIMGEITAAVFGRCCCGLCVVLFIVFCCFVLCCAVRCLLYAVALPVVTWLLWFAGARTLMKPQRSVPFRAPQNPRKAWGD